MLTVATLEQFVQTSHMRQFRGGSAFRAFVVSLLVTGCSSSSSSTPAQPPPADGGADGAVVDAGPGPTLVQTDHGPVQGTMLDTTRRFAGIPFAAPPVGALRWKPPADPAAWTKPLQATNLGPACTGISLSGGPATGTSEDCLTINVWTPLEKTAHAPVLLWIYGGGFVGGGSNDSGYDGAALASSQGVIVVTFNYRLGALGFLSSKALAAEEGVTVAPSFGVQDQLAALKWVHANIAAFGGDPANVTLFGESAGAWSTCIHLAMPASKGLFQHAMMESGNCGSLLYATPAEAQAQATQFATALGCTDPSTELSCLRGKDAAAVLAALPGKRALIGPTGVDWGPVVDGAALPSLPLDAIRAGQWAKVPVLLGSNHDEGNLFTYLWNTGTPALGSADVLPIAQTNFGMTNAAAIVSHYSGSAYPDAKAQVSGMLTDGVFACPMRRAARAIVGGGNVAFLYQFTHPFNTLSLTGLGAAHSFELPYVWGNTWLGTRPPDTDSPLVTAMQAYWARFAATGDPNGGGAPTWPKYSESSDENIVLDLHIATATGLKKADCDFWDALP